MKRIYKNISILLVFIFTLVTCSACVKTEMVSKVENGPVSLVTTPETSTLRYMNSSLYLGYLGAQRDFAIVVDKDQSSPMYEMIGTGGIKAGNFININKGETVSTGSNLLVYYMPSSEYLEIGKAKKEGWFGRIATPVGPGEYDQSYVEDNLLEYSCGHDGNSMKSVCESVKAIENDTISNSGKAILLLFNDGKLYNSIKENSLNFNDKPMNALIARLKSNINVSFATRTAASNETNSRQKINVLKSISELEDLVTGKKNVKDYLLLITSDGFIEEKIGNNVRYDKTVEPDLMDPDNLDEEIKMEDGYEEIASDINQLRQVVNHLSIYNDNCAGKNDELSKFLKETLQAWLMGTLITTLIPWPLSMLLQASIFKNNSDASDLITDTNFCQIMTSALKGVEINVPIYQYNINSAKENIEDYKANKLSDTRLKAYYDENKALCQNQFTLFKLPGKMPLSRLFDTNEEYIYSDKCEKELVSRTVNGFGGSPSLQLYLNGSKADDLYGRVTTELIIEMMNVWGLNSTGNLYNKETNRTLNDMSFKVGIINESITNIGYCVSTDAYANCDSTLPVTMGKDEFSVNITDEYKTFSREHVSEVITETLINTATLIDAKDENKNWYMAMNNGNKWEFAKYFQDDEYPMGLTNLLTKSVNILKNNLGSMYLVKKKDVIYAMCDDGTVVGFKKVLKDGIDTMKIAYLYDGNTEYIFDENTTNPDITLEKMVSEYLVLEGRNQKSINSAHSFYVYVQYKIGDDTYYYMYGF